MDRLSFWVLLIIVIILIAFLYKLFNSKKQLLEIAQGFLKKISEKDDYLFLNTQQVLCLPLDLKLQTEKLLSEIKEMPCTIDDYVTELPNSRILLLLNPVSENTRRKKVIGLLKIFLLSESLPTRDRVLSKVKPAIVADNPIYISSVIIDQRYRGQGFGGKMFDILSRLLKKDVILEVKKINDPAIKLYRKLNFKIIGQNKDEYLMKKFRL